jgi:hypothetical protein
MELAYENAETANPSYTCFEKGIMDILEINELLKREKLESQFRIYLFCKV